MKSAVCVIVKVENLYLPEWISHYVNLGFNHIFIYDNNNPTGEKVSDVITDEYRPYVTIINCRGELKYQIKAYNDCYKKYGDFYDWIAFIDADEFISFSPSSGYSNINSYLENASDYDAVLLNWMCVGDNGETYYREGKLKERFPQAAPLDIEKNKHVKSIVRTKKGYIFRIPHIAEGNINACDDCFLRCKNTALKEQSYKNAYVLHYYTKSLEEFLNGKILRGSTDSWFNRYNLDLYYELNDHTEEKNLLEKKYLTIWTRTIIPNVEKMRYAFWQFLKKSIKKVIS